MGKATYTDDCILPFYGYSPVSYPVEMQRNEKNPNRLRLVNPYGKPYPYYGAEDAEAYGPDNRYMEIDITDPDNVQVPIFNTGLDWDSGYFYVGSRPNYPGGVYDAASGSITFPQYGMTIWDSDIYDRMENGLGGYTVNGQCTIYLPGFLPKDYSADVAYGGVTIDSEGTVYAKAVVTLGADVAIAKAGLVETRSLSVASNLIDSGDVETQTLNAGENQPVSFEVSANGAYMIAVVVYDAEGNIVSVAGDTFTINNVGQSENWVSIGDCPMYDAWLIPALFGANPYGYRYYTEVQESESTPGLYRLVNPFGEDSPIGNYNDDPSTNYVVIDATDPEFVLMDIQYSGFTMSNGAEFYITDLASYYYNKGVMTKDEIIAEEFNNVIVDKVIYMIAPMFSMGGQQWSFSSDSEEDTPSIIYLPGYEEYLPSAQSAAAKASRAAQAAKALSAPVAAYNLNHQIIKKYKFVKSVEL